MYTSLKQLMNNYSQAGTVEWIGIRPDKKLELISIKHAMLDPLNGIEGDHYAGRTGKRQVTLIQSEHLPVIASMMKMDNIKPEQLRRNIVVSALNLLALKGKMFNLGEAVLEYTGLCHPCSRMEKTLGLGGYNAIRGHGGITARVVQSGKVKVGEQCKFVQKEHNGI